MAKARKDNKGRALQKGESQRSQDNRYIYTYTNLYGKRVYVYALTLQELRDKEREILRNHLNGVDLYSAEKLDLNSLVDKYLHLKKNVTTTTISHYSSNYNRYCKDTIGKCKVASIKYSDILSFYQDLMSKGMKVDMVHKLNNVLSHAFEMAVRDCIIRANPCADAMASIKKGKTKEKTRRALSIEEQQKFLGFLAEHPEFSECECLFVVMLGTGMRIGEISGLRWDDIDFEKKVIDVNHAITYSTRSIEPPYPYEFHYELPKTAAGVRKIPMIGMVYDALSKLYEEQEASGFSNMVIDGVSGFVFSTKRGKPYYSENVNDHIQKIIKAHNAEETTKAKEEKRSPVLLPHFSCHSLRHTFCTRFCENETNAKIVQAVMGHASIQTTMDIYAEVSEAAKEKAMEELAKNCMIF